MSNSKDKISLRDRLISFGISSGLTGILTSTAADLIYYSKPGEEHYVSAAACTALGMISLYYAYKIGKSILEDYKG